MERKTGFRKIRFLPIFTEKPGDSLSFFSLFCIHGLSKNLEKEIRKGKAATRVSDDERMREVTGDG